MQSTHTSDDKYDKLQLIWLTFEDRWARYQIWWWELTFVRKNDAREEDVYIIILAWEHDASMEQIVCKNLDVIDNIRHRTRVKELRNGEEKIIRAKILQRGSKKSEILGKWDSLRTKTLGLFLEARALDVHQAQGPTWYKLELNYREIYSRNRWNVRESNTRKANMCIIWHAKN